MTSQTRWLDRFRGREAKTSRARRLVALTAAGRPHWTPVDYRALAREGFARNPVAYRCIRMIAEAAASAPLVVFRRHHPAPDHPLQTLLDRPNPEEAGVDLLESFFGALQTCGNAYLEAAGDGDTPTELYVLRPDRVKVVPGSQGWPDAYEYQAQGRSVRLARASDGFLPVLHLKLYNPTDDYYGFSPLEAARFAIDVHNASSAWNKASALPAMRRCPPCGSASSTASRAHIWRMRRTGAPAASCAASTRRKSSASVSLSSQTRASSAMTRSSRYSRSQAAPNWRSSAARSSSSSPRRS